MGKKQNHSAENLLDELSLLLIDISPSDFQELAQAHEKFLQLGKMPDIPPESALSIKKAESLIENIIMGEEPFEEGMKNLLLIVKTLQSIFLGTKTKSSSPADDESVKAEEMRVADDAIVKDFLQRQPSLLEDFEGKILEAENGDKDAVSEIRRLLHTWKGEAGVLDLLQLQEFIHKVESCISETNSEISIDGLFAVKDLLENYFKLMMSESVPQIQPEEAERIYSLFIQAAGSKTTEPKKTSKEDIPQDLEPEKSAQAPSEIPLIDFSGDQSLMFDFISESQEHLQNAEVMLMNVETEPEDKESLNAIFRAFHTIKGVASFIGMKDITELSHKAETMLDKARKGEIQLTGIYIDITFDALDLLKTMVGNVQKAMAGDEYIVPENFQNILYRIENPETQEELRIVPPEPGRKVGEILIEKGKVSDESVKKATELQQSGDERPIGKILVDEGETKPKEVVQALRAQKAPEKDKKVKTGIETTVKVGTSRLDNLIDMVGELVIANAMVAQEVDVGSNGNEKLTRNVSHLGKISRELQEISMSLRMVSVKATFQKMARLVRDLAKKNKKMVAFTMEGEDTELDRNVVEEIGDPLVHMVRNAIDHGIETPEERKTAGKPECGTVKLHAFHQGGNVIIELEDDGKGLNREKIIEKAVRMGVIKDSEILSDNEIDNLIFHPGLSTAKKVTDVSGRGVGMDVVRKNIEALRGHVNIKSTPGQGSVVSLMLPLTLAIIDGMIVRVGNEKFIIPTISVLESFQPTRDQITEIAGKGKVINLRNKLLPLYSLHNLFRISNAETDPCNALVIVLSSSGNGNARCFVVDELIGQQQVVIKSIGKGLGELEGISGGAILGDGRVSLILDPVGIVNVAESSSNKKN